MQWLGETLELNLGKSQNVIPMYLDNYISQLKPLFRRRFLDASSWPFPASADHLLVQMGLLEQGDQVEILEDNCAGWEGPTADQLRVVAHVSYYLDRVAQSTVGACGICANILAAYVLSVSRRLSASVFNCLLAGLLAVHSLYIAACLAIEVYKGVGGAIFEYVFSIFLHPCKPMLLYTSTLITVVMARWG